MFEEIPAWLFAWVSQDSARPWIFIAVCVIAVLMWAVASLLEMGTEFGVAAISGLLISGNAGFFLGFTVFSTVFLVLFVVLGSVAGRWSVAVDFVFSVFVGWIAAVAMGPLFGLAGFAGAFLAIGAVLNKLERAPPQTFPAAPQA